MRKVVFLFVTCFFVVNLYSQTETADKKNTIGTHIGYGIGGVNAVGAMPNYLNVGIDYSRKFSERWSFCIGAEQLGFLGIRGINKITWHGDTLEVNSINKKGPHWDITSIPVQLKYNFRNIAYISFGTALNVFNFGYSTKVGVGWSFGAGLEREFNNNLTFSLNPYIGWSGAILEQANKGGGKDTRYVKLGVSLGVGYKF